MGQQQGALERKAAVVLTSDLICIMGRLGRLTLVGTAAYLFEHFMYKNAALLSPACSYISK